MIPATHWLLLGAFLCAAANAGPPLRLPATPAPEAPTPAAEAPDEGFIEFLGADDVEDALWWEFLKKAPPRGKDTPATPPQDAKQ